MPTRIYFKGSHAKVEIALARARTWATSASSIKEREMKREMQRALARAAEYVAETVALQVRQVHPDAEQHDQPDVDGADEEPVARA